MTYGAWGYNLCQMGQESTPGTSVAGSTVWRGVFGGWNDTRTREVVPEDVGTLARSERTYDGMYGVEVPMPETGLTFEQYPHVLQASMGVVTPTGTGTYTYEYAVPTDDTVPELQTYTLLLGNKLVSADVAALLYSHVYEWEASGEAGGNWTISASWRGNRYTTGSFASVSLPTVEDAIFAKTKLYIDAQGGTIGTTQKTGVLVGASIKYRANVEFVPVGDGSLYAISHKLGQPSVTFTLKLELEQSSGVSTVATERGFYNSNTPRLIRLAVDGSSGKKITWDLAARYDNFGAYEKQGEQDTAVTIEGHCDLNTTADLFFSTTVINALSAIP